MPAPDSVQTAVISGGTRGIGLAVARTLSARGWRVALLYRSDHAAAQKALALFPAERTLLVHADVATADGVAHAAASVHAAFGDVQVLINNAGTSLIKLFSDTEEADWDATINDNLKSVYLMCRAFLPDMYRARYGRIVNVSSVWGLRGGGMEVAYSAAKAGVIGLSKALAQEVGRMGITVNAVAPGFIDTDMNATLGEEVRAQWAEDCALGRIGTPQEVAAAICFLASPEASYLTGTVLPVLG